VLRPPNLGLKAGVAEDVQQFVRTADDAVYPIERSRVGNRSVRLYYIGQHEQSVFGQPLRNAGKQVCLRLPVDVMQSKCGHDQLERPVRKWVLEAAESQLCSRAQNVSRCVQLVSACVEAHGARRRVRLQTSS
jgi:hypothetical protein